MSNPTAPEFAASLATILPPADSLAHHRTRYLVASVLPALCEMRSQGRLAPGSDLRQVTSLCSLRAMVTDHRLSSEAQAGVRRYLDGLLGWNCQATVPGVWQQVATAHSEATEIFG